MKNPLYFLNGEYSNTALVQAQLSHSIYSDMVHNPLKASIFVIKMVLLFSAPLISILILRLINHRLVRWDTLILLGMFLSISMVQIIMLVTGTTFAWLRYFMYGLPVAVAWLPYELSKVKRQWHVIIPLIAMIANYGILSYVVTQPSMAPEENKFLQNSFGNQNEVDDDWKQQSEIARYLDDNYAHSSILVDTSSAFFIILQSKFPTQFYIPSDKEFINAVTDPEKYKVSYILLPNPKLVSGINVINMAYPNLYNQGADWVELVKEFGAKWKLYKVIQSTGRYALNTNNYAF
ncbi:conserved membrane hypothetical protein [Candidatus Desulfosporosinus infrequens]|uniref:Uncharacterized protein n=1 Tax=Candidatus Desulfosporosinus infrequens TaxID=2043169 RepID=A0A2U3L6F7_9FIRM|nr:conserved membrane hypothetical protein [Candidatus Desulfosporosinus infrequens]